ncbi:MAG TPA: glycerate kinase [Thermoleophilaceae bacterium]|nr:glycerate kinase [Thermoleophilaceae bacterium]
MKLSALVAPDSFKGTYSAREVAAAIAEGLRAGGVDAVEMPVADGGEGTMDALLATLEGRLFAAEVSDPLGNPVQASFALLGDGTTAFVECAQASGMNLVPEEDIDAIAASTRGTGELMVAACEAGATTILVGVGGSATTDGGAGAVAAVQEAGVRPRIEVVCDVRTPFEDAPKVFAPQKGATPEQVDELEQRQRELAEAAPKDPRGVPMTGAAGGLSGGLWAHLGAKLVPGAPYVLDRLGFDDALRSASFVVTGEGRLDRQTLAGKIVGEVATRARQSGVRCHAVVGGRELDDFEARILDLETVTEAGDADAFTAAGRELAERALG